MPEANLPISPAQKTLMLSLKDASAAVPLNAHHKVVQALADRAWLSLDKSGKKGKLTAAGKKALSKATFKIPE